jgi:long-chain fatty acid transport protein
VFASLGTEYRASPDWTFHGGAGFDQTPVPDTTREPRIPDADRVWVALGATYRLSPRCDLKVSAARLFNVGENVALSPAIPGAALRGILSGSTRSYVNVLGLEIVYRWDK